MMKCLNCNKEVPQTEAKRNKLYCDEVCRSAYRRKTAKPNPVESLPVKPITVAEVEAQMNSTDDTLQKKKFEVLADVDRVIQTPEGYKDLTLSEAYSVLKSGKPLIDFKL